MFVILCTDTYVRDETVLFHNVCCFPVEWWTICSLSTYESVASHMFLFAVHHARDVYCNIRWVA